MRILGIHDAIDSAAAIIENGRIIAAVSEERIIREKLAFGFPLEAIVAVLEVAKLKPQDIDYVAVATKNNYLINRIVPFNGWYESKNGFLRPLFLSLASKISPLATKVRSLEKAYYSLRSPIFAYRRWKIPEILKNNLGFSCPLTFIDHHFAHACSAYFSSGHEDATVVTLDGGGDGLSSAVYQVRKGVFKKLTESSSLNSIGNFYSYVTYICGFKTHRHEGKITGLAAYGEPEYIDVFKSLIDIDNGKIVNTSKLFGTSAINRIRALLPRDFKPENVACSIQQHLENVATRYVRFWLGKTRIPNLALAGGVFGNVKLNQRLKELEEVGSIFIHPAMGDDGIAVGAALALYHGLKPANKVGEISRCMDHVYFGPEFSSKDIEDELKRNTVSHTFYENVEDEIAKLLAEGYVVARFNERMEYGPRALGNRSILSQATDPKVNDWLNKNLKRTEFMPFAPSTLEEYAPQCYLNVDGASDAARFMTITFDCTDWMRRSCPGVVHVDNTARPQLVNKDDNPGYYKIIDEYRKLTGLPSIINTSFNIHEEPIVCTPADAIRAFKSGHLDYLAVGNYLVKNPDTKPRPAPMVA